jgi:hypothetical protein
MTQSVAARAQQTLSNLGPKERPLMSHPDPDAPRRRGRPRTGVTPKRNIRVGKVWDEAAAIAETRDETMTEVVTRLLQRYVSTHRREVTRAAADQEVEAARETARQRARQADA